MERITSHSAASTPVGRAISAVVGFGGFDLAFPCLDLLPSFESSPVYGCLRYRFLGVVVTFKTVLRSIFVVLDDLQNKIEWIT